MPEQFLGILVDVEEGGVIRVPLDKLDSAGIRVGSKVEIFANNSGLTFRNTEDICEWCGINGKMRIVDGKKICDACVEKIKLINL